MSELESLSKFTKLEERLREQQNSQASLSLPESSKRKRTLPLKAPENTTNSVEDVSLVSREDTNSPRKKQRLTGNIMKYFREVPITPERMWEWDRELKLKEDRLRSKEEELSMKEHELGGVERTLKQRENLTRQCFEQEETEFGKQNIRLRDLLSRARSALLESVTKAAQQERETVWKNLVERQQRLGRVAHKRQGVTITEVFEPGPDFRDIESKLYVVHEEQKSIDKHRRAMGRKRKQQSTTDVEASPGDDAKTSIQEVALQDEIYKLRKELLKKEEQHLVSKKEELEVEKVILLRDLRKRRDEEYSQFNQFQCLKDDRYVLLHLLGKGGFSEVYKSFDLHECRIVACKIHQLNPQWTEERKQNYVKHAIREYEIHRRLDHERVVRLFDVFEIDTSCFCTVLEFCEGPDLDLYLKIHRHLPERECRAIVLQIFHGLKYLSEQKQRIIHYDIKPANILFHRHEVKITDFGLAKVIEDESAQHIELTSQGAGTYWYLPPECFLDDSEGKPRISTKVDVWATGVVFFEMLFGRRPFGHNMSQQKILADSIILNSKKVEIPTQTPSGQKISAEAKSFLEKCLEPNQYERGDIDEIIRHPYLQLKK